MRGVTIVEVIIICVIITVLASIATPNFILLRENARSRICLNNMRKIHEAAATGVLAGQEGMEFSALFEEGRMPACPSGGIYSYGSTMPSSTYRDHSITCSAHPDLPAQGYEE